MPAIFDTITRLFPVSLFTKDDFPTFGLPTTAILGLSSSSSSNSSPSKCSTTRSSKSPIPSLDDADIGCGSPIPKL